MTLPLAMLQRDDNWGSYILFLIFVVAPLVARGLKWLMNRGRESAEAGQEREDPRERLRRQREERRRAEVEGEDLWRRLARGEVAEAPPPAVPPPRPPPRPQPERAPSFERELSMEREASLEREAPAERELSLEREEDPTPLSVLGEVSEPGEAQETSLETELRPEPLAASAQTVVTRAPRSRRRTAFAPGDMRHAIVIAEVLGPPLADRSPRS